MRWWQRLPTRLLDEESALESLCKESSPLVSAYRWHREADGELYLRATLNLVDPQEVEVRFPPHYPEGCPSVRPIPYASLSSHQFGGSGVLCLEFGPDNWHPHYIAADMLRSAWSLLARELISTVKPMEIPSRHEVDLAERVRVNDGVFFMSPELDKLIEASESTTAFEFVFPIHRTGFRIFPVSYPAGTPLILPPALAAESHRSGLVARLGDDAPERVPTDPQEFNDFVSKFGKTEVVEDKTLAVVLRWPSGTKRAFLRMGKRVMKLAFMDFSGDAHERVPRDLERVVSTLQIAIVGAGSLGSKVALSLARVGVRRFVLVDGDVLQSHNICRHEADFADVGALKVDVVKDLVMNACDTEAEVVTYSVNLATAANPDVHARVLEVLGKADLIIDATANPEVFCLLAMIASDNRKPLVWGEVFGGGLGGLLASAHPDDGPCPRCVRAGFLAAAAEWPTAPAANGTLPYAGGEENPVIATDADVALVAAALTNRVLDVATARERPPAVTLLGIRRGWIFEAAMQSVNVPVRSDDWQCPRCWTSATENDVAGTAQVEKLLAMQDDADDLPTS